MSPTTTVSIGLLLANLAAVGLGLYGWRPRVVFCGIFARRGVRRALEPGFDRLIEEVDQAEAERRTPEYGSEAWWQAWAEGGGRLPQAARSGRGAAAAPGRTRASLRQAERSA